jgi:hypothetical protein
MNIIVRNMIQSDIDGLSRAFAAQGWLLPASVFENCFNRMLHRHCDMIVAEAKGHPAGYLRLEWVDAEDEDGTALMPEIQEFIVLGRFAGMGVAEALNAEAERRVSYKTGEAAENALMAVYGDPPPRPPYKRSFVLEGLYVGADGRFIRARSATEAKGGMVISMRRQRR